MSQWRSTSFGGKNSTAGGVIPDAVKMFMTQQNKTIPQDSNLDFVSKKSTDPLTLFNSQQQKAKIPIKKTVAPAAPKILLATPNAAGAALPLTNSLVEAIKATNKEDPLAAIFPGQTPKSVAALESKPTVTDDALAAEEFMASLANPLFKQMPVDKSLVAALRSMGGVGVNSPNPKYQLLPGLQKRRKRSLGSAVTNRHFLSKVLKKHLRKRREAAGITKPMERSSMETPVRMTSQEGPKLLDKIRDMGRVIATP